MSSIKIAEGLTEGTVSVDNIVFDDVTLKLKTPIEAAYFEEDGMWYFQYELLGITSFGATSDEAYRQFEEDFISQWENIAQAPDGDLAPDALRVKAAMLALVAS